MAAQCIVCDSPAGSREHVFPAALGGRRMNKGIYCEKHNGELGHHVTELLKALSYFNASLGVRSDHHKIPKPHLIETPEGDRYQLLEDSIELAPPRSLTETPELLGKEATLAFASIQQRDQWIAQQKARGFEFKSATTGPSKTEYFTTPLKQRFEFGSEAFRRAIAYLALTHLAHYFPSIARRNDLSSIIQYVRGEEEVEDRVWWIDPTSVTVPTNDSFQSMHSVVISLSEATGKVTALVTLFGYLCLGVYLGTTNIDKDKSITTLIDPLSEHAAPEKDILKISQESSLELPPKEDSKIWLSKVVSGEVDNPVAQILTSHHKKHLSALVSRLLPLLKSTKNKDKAEQLSLIKELVDEQGQRILNQLTKGLELLAAESELPANVRAAFESAIAEDPNSDYGLANKSMHYLSLAKAAVTNEIIRHLDEDTLDEENLALLLSDGPGIALVTQAVTAEIIYSLPLR